MSWMAIGSLAYFKFFLKYMWLKKYNQNLQMCLPSSSLSYSENAAWIAESMLLRRLYSHSPF